MDYTCYFDWYDCHVLRITTMVQLSVIVSLSYGCNNQN